MKLPTFSTISLLLTSGMAQMIQKPPSFTPLFNVTLVLSEDQVGPIPVPGGVQVVRPITSGVVTGAFEANITGGVAYPSIYQNETIQFVLGNIWGDAEGANGTSVPFFVNENGVVGANSRFNRLTLNIGGDLSNLSTAYIISTPSNLNATTILEQAFLVY